MNRLCQYLVQSSILSYDSPEGKSIAPSLQPSCSFLLPPTYDVMVCNDACTLDTDGHMAVISSDSLLHCYFKKKEIFLSFSTTRKIFA